MIEVMVEPPVVVAVVGGGVAGHQLPAAGVQSLPPPAVAVAQVAGIQALVLNKNYENSKSKF
jgi:hypothetical protein